MRFALRDEMWYVVTDLMGSRVIVVGRSAGSGANVGGLWGTHPQSQSRRRQTSPFYRHVRDEIGRQQES
jgi:hypothetical protein